ncbi:hypothetical protein [Ochrobactrum sp. S1502_03]|uniref:hypothetical protein n=1 Tax=Brucella/Ochrobactrum group TaxID=2826938 RepID=UPI0037CB3EAB
MLRSDNEAGGPEPAKAKPQQVIIIHETVLKSWLRDASTFALFLALIGIGILLQSVALQWVGAIIGFIVVGTRASMIRKCFTISDARKRLDEMEASL